MRPNLSDGYAGLAAACFIFAILVGGAALAATHKEAEPEAAKAKGEAIAANASEAIRIGLIVRAPQMNRALAACVNKPNGFARDCCRANAHGNRQLRQQWYDRASEYMDEMLPGLEVHSAHELARQDAYGLILDFDSCGDSTIPKHRAMFQRLRTAHQRLKKLEEARQGARKARRRLMLRLRQEPPDRHEPVQF